MRSIVYIFDPVFRSKAIPLLKKSSLKDSGWGIELDIELLESRKKIIFLQKIIVDRAEAFVWNLDLGQAVSISQTASEVILQGVHIYGPYHSNFPLT
ncbi:MAG TPA: hypothetical protein DCR93_13880 [Cytophagales bacterium]|nr:hypothetical protein [Cytophagales bacterium]HAP60529.1 hypothetical protein [Cytophagales bacterium]